MVTVKGQSVLMVVNRRPPVRLNWETARSAASMISLARPKIASESERSKRISIQSIAVMIATDSSSHFHL